MRAYLVATLGVALLIGLVALAVERLGLPLLDDPSGWLGAGGAPAALLGLALLVLDVALPVPSSLVMLAHGALFGVLVGTLLSLVGSVGAALLGFWVGRRGGPLLARLAPDEQRARAAEWLVRWGPLAIVATRPVPVLAETTAIVAGTSPLSWRALALAAALGSLPAAALYAVAGAAGARAEHNLLLVAAAVLLTGLLWLAGRLLGR